MTEFITNLNIFFSFWFIFSLFVFASLLVLKLIFDII